MTGSEFYGQILPLGQRQEAAHLRQPPAGNEDRTIMGRGMAIENAFGQSRNGKSGYRLTGVHVFRRIVIAGQNNERTGFFMGQIEGHADTISSASTPLKSRLRDCK
jgi:hypothetical protein